MFKQQPKECPNRVDGSTGATVPGHPQNFENECQASVLRETVGANRPNFIRNFETLLESATWLSLGENSAMFWDFFGSWAPVL